MCLQYGMTIIMINEIFAPPADAAEDVAPSITIATIEPTPLSTAPSLVLHTVTVTVIQNTTTGCPCEVSPCSSEGRLPNLFAIIIGVIPSTIAIALLFLLFVVVSSNRKRKKRAIKIYNCQTPDQNNTPGSRRGMQVRDFDFPPRQDAISTSQLHYLSSDHSRSTSGPIEVDRPLLPDPPTPCFEDNSNPVRGNTFSFVMPSLSYPESSFIKSSEVSNNQVWLGDETERFPVMGLESIHEEQEEGQGGVASIIARLERGKGQIITTEC